MKYYQRKLYTQHLKACKVKCENWKDIEIHRRFDIYEKYLLEPMEECMKRIKDTTVLLQTKRKVELFASTLYQIKLG